MRTECTYEGDNEIIFSQHSFAVYPIVTQAVNAKAVVTPAKDWGHDLSAMQAAISDNTKLIFIANPNNPTGTWLGEQELHQFLSKVPTDVITVIDEAYFDYAIDKQLGASDYPNAMAWLSELSSGSERRACVARWVKYMLMSEMKFELGFGRIVIASLESTEAVTKIFFLAMYCYCFAPLIDKFMFVLLIVHL